nr:hypothetical protein [Tanacetum cinerariifolium]
LEQPNEPPLTEGHAFGSGEGRLEENNELTDTIPTPMIHLSHETSVPLNLEGDEAVNQEEVDRVERAITSDASLEAAHDSDNITKTQTMGIPNVDIPQGSYTGGRPRRQETIRGTSA